MTPAEMRRVAAAHRPLRDSLRVLTLDAEVWATEQGVAQFWRAIPVPTAMQRLSARDRDDFGDALLCVLFSAVARPFLTDDEIRALGAAWGGVPLRFPVSVESLRAHGIEIK